MYIGKSERNIADKHKLNFADHPMMRWGISYPIATLYLCIPLILLAQQFLPGICQTIIEGSDTKCDEEGKEVYISLISDDPCIRCICQNGVVACEQKSCKSLEGCYLVLFDTFGSRKQCCDVCKGCIHKGAIYKSGSEWRDPRDSCIIYSCKAAVVTRSRIQCYAPCQNPVMSPGECCPSCKGCSFGGKIFKEGDVFFPGGESRLECTCQKGSISCKKQACPLLNCPPEKTLHPREKGCPKCKGSRKIFDSLGICFFQNKVYNENDVVQPDECTNCTCHNDTLICDVTSCPVLICPENQRYRSDGSCCWKCRVHALTGCHADGRIYGHGQSWKVNVCTTCTCRNGVRKCTHEQCNNALQCPKGFKLQFTPDTCCPSCAEEAVCTVFGDPHYRTFDGKIYNFQGHCKYILSEDCVRKTFSIKVQNDARLTSGFSWTRRVTVFLGKDKITLQQNLVVKVNRRRAKLPVRKRADFSIRQEGHFVVLKTAARVEVVWDGDSFLEITMPGSYKGQLCGLCGNYNGNTTDDLTGRDGVVHFNQREFGDTWRVGSRFACRNRPKLRSLESPCRKDFRSRKRAHRECRILTSDVFSECRKRVDVQMYYRSCAMDMCDCPKSKLCSCESLLAYSRACAREGVVVSQEKYGHCKDMTCPKGAVFDNCGPACARTCSNINKVDRSCFRKPCVRGCHCPAGTVFHEGRCISAHHCPKHQLTN